MTTTKQKVYSPESHSTSTLPKSPKPPQPFVTATAYSHHATTTAAYKAAPQNQPLPLLLFLSHPNLRLSNFFFHIFIVIKFGLLELLNIFL